MTFGEFLYSKIITLCFLGIGALFSGAFLALADTGAPVICAGAALFVSGTALWLAVSFFVEKSRIKRLEKLIEELPEKYLLGEVLPAPVNVLERQYFQIMQVVSQSAVGVAEEAGREKEEYCDYVERWIHEIKTPLTACSLILANGGDSRKLKREIRRADNLTESILYYARMRSIQKDTQISKVQAADIVEKAVKSQMELLIAAGISVLPQGDFTVYTDEKTVCFILKQLLINCAKYCPGCQICITAEDGKIQVRDNGTGIPSHDLGRVTERGFVGTNGRKLGGSTGMGLYIVKELCDRLEIALEITSKEKEYTCITLAFLQFC